jgi:SAM-dependent methyltransferase
MNEVEKVEAINRYNQRLAEHGYNPLSLGWTKRKHFLRYHALLNNWKFNGESILDFGCGFGDLYKYITANRLLLKYEGVDINQQLVEVGKREIPGINLRVGDLAFDQRKNCYDYIVSSGVHNYKISDNWGFIQWTFDKFYNMARSGFAINFLSNRVEFEKTELYYADPVRILELAYSYSNNVVIRNDYMPFEFTVVVNVKRSYDKDFVIYPEYKDHLIACGGI